MATSKPTMKDVARLAGVSPMTVSRFLARPAVVSAAKAKRINDAIDRLGYVPNRIAGSLSSNRTGFVAAVVPTLHNANFADTAHGLTETLNAAGYQLLIGYTEYAIAAEEDIVRTMLGRRPEAIVLTGGNHTGRTIELLRQEAIPTVEMWDYPATPIDMGVGFSNYRVGRAMTEHLIALGYRRIACIAPNAGGATRDFRGEERLRGFRDALAAAGLAADLVADDLPPPMSFREGSRAAARILDDFDAVEAIFAVSDLAAVGALSECQRRGVAVPQAVGIAGFGDFEISSVVNPPLTTVQVNPREIGRVAGRAVIEALQSGTKIPVQDLGFEVLSRASTSAAPALQGAG